MTQRETALIERPKVIPVARTLYGARAEERLKTYRKFIEQFSNQKAKDSLGVLTYNEQTQDLEQSNLFSSIAMAQTDIESKRTARLADLTKILTQDDAFFDGIYAVAPEICLRSVGDSYVNNDFVARELAKKLKIKRFGGTPFVVTDLTLVEDERSAYGLILVPTQTTRIVKAPALAYKGNDTFRFSEVDENNTPIPREDGIRTCWVRKDGLSGFYVGRHVLNSGNRGLAGSDGGGRVVEISAEGATQNFEAQIIRVRKAYGDAVQRAEAITQGAISKLEALQ